VARSISDSTVRRLSHYLRALEDLEASGADSVSSDQLAHRGGTTAAQVRKDLSHFGSFGKRGHGYQVCSLSRTLKSILGLDGLWQVALVGAGRIGAALFKYPAFQARGYECTAILDNDPAKIGQRWGDVIIRPISDLEKVVRDRGIDLVILAVPVMSAQEIAGRAVQAGVRGILNFAPTRLRVPANIPVTNVNLVIELEALSFALTRRSREA
jgi:redox-sensing transcriptional repressor